MSKELFDKVAASITKDHPSFKIRFKNESRLMRLIALLVYPFNPRFMDGYVTTLGSTVYFSSRASLEKSYRSNAGVLAHEGVHIFDAEKHGLWFSISYALNQLLIIPLMALYAFLGSWKPVAVMLAGVTLSYLTLALVRLVTSSALACGIVFYICIGATGVMYGALAIWLSGWWALLALGAFFPLIPYRSYWRTKWEMRGYAMNIAMGHWRYGAVTDSYLLGLAGTFTGPDYYYMDINYARVLGRLRAIRASVVDGSILTGSDAAPYVRTHDVMKQLGLVDA